ncbi:MAG: GNAT family N-acetyltransferase [Leptolyngbyaceae cyanobacterium]
MQACVTRTDVIFVENEEVDVEQLNILYQICDWDAGEQRTDEKTAEMLRLSHYYIAAYAENNLLVGFARVCGDPYVAQVLDVMTHPLYRREGIATRCMLGVLAYLWRSNYVSVTLNDCSGVPDFYSQFGFRPPHADAIPWVWRGSCHSPI